MGGVGGARWRVVIDVFVALVRAWSGPLLIPGKIHLLSTLVPSSLLVYLVLARTCSQSPPVLYLHLMVSHVFAKVQLLQVHSQFLAVLETHSRAPRPFAEVGMVRVLLQLLVAPCRVVVEVSMIQASPCSLGALYLHLMVCRVSFWVGKLLAAPRVLQVLNSHLKVVLSSSGF
jgi:hypothetical protein